MKQTIISIIIIIAVVFAVVFLMKSQQGPQKQAKNEEQSMEQNNQQLPTELTVMVTQEGVGEQVLQPGNIAVVHYTGMLSDGVVFDSSLTRGQPFEFPYGTGSVILGWDQGLQDMKVGEKRELIIPPAYGYGDNQVGPIPPNSTLIFEVELLEIK